MTAREKSKRKALHRGLDDIVNRDASLTSRLLGRVKSPSREPLDVPSEADDASRDVELGMATPKVDELSSREEGGKSEAAAIKLSPQESGASVHRLEVSRVEKGRQRQSTGDDVVAKHESRTERTQGELLNVAPVSAAIATFDDFVATWGFILRSGGRTGKLRICKVLYNNTYAVNKETFFTSYEKLARLTNLEKKQCAINVKQLESSGFIERLNIFNTATKQGTEFKLHLNPLPPNARRNPQYHHYNEDLS